MNKPLGRCLRVSGILAVILFAATISAEEGRPLGFELLEADIARIQRAFAVGTLTSEALTQAYLDRIAAYEDTGPAINSFIFINEDALDAARALDRERALKGPRGPLHGVPIVIKDNYDTKDMPTTGGSVALEDHRPDRDAFTVQRLRDAGAVILGKTNLSELALSYGWLGYSSVGGITLNPYNLSRNASGSSSGTAAAVAANLAVLGTGTDTAGSIRGPAAVNGVVGIKPTLGLTSRAGVIPASLSFDVTGPIARTVRDAAIALGVMAGVDPDDPRTASSAEWQVAYYLPSLDLQALTDARIGVLRDFTGANPEVDAAFDRALAVLRKQGATLEDIPLPKFIREAWSTMMGRVVDTEFRDQIEAYLEATDAPVATLAEVIAVSESPQVKDSATPVNPARIEGYREALESRGVADLEYLDILTNRTPAARRAVERRMEEQDLDALVFPTLLCPASPLYDEPDDTYICNAPDPYAPCYLASTTGFPEVTVPMGFTEQGLPVGLSFFGTAYTEPRLLGLAYAFEQATKVREPPPTTPALR
jgi:amidase